MPNRLQVPNKPQEAEKEIHEPLRLAAEETSLAKDTKEEPSALPELKAKTSQPKQGSQK